MKVSTRPVARVAAVSMFALTSVMGVAAVAADDPEADPAPTGPALTVQDATVDQFQSIEVNGKNFSTKDGTDVRIVATQVPVVNPDPEAPPTPAFSAITNAGQVSADGSLPPSASAEPDRDFVEVYTNDSWPEGDYKVAATYTDKTGQRVSTDAVDVAIVDTDRQPAIGGDFNEDGSLEAGKTFKVEGAGSTLVTDETIGVTLHKRGQTAVVTRFDTTILTYLEGVLTGANTFTLPEGLQAGQYTVQLSVRTGDAATSIARLPIRVKEKYVAPPPNPEPTPDPKPVDPPVVLPPVVTSPDAPSTPPTTPPKTPVVPTPAPAPAPEPTVPVTKEPVAKPPAQTPSVVNGDGDDDAKKDAPKADTNTTDAEDPKPVTDDEPELEALPGLTFDDDDDVVDATLAGAPQTDTISAMPLFIGLGAMAVLAAGVGVGIRRFTA